VRSAVAGCAYGSAGVGGTAGRVARPQQTGSPGAGDRSMSTSAVNRGPRPPVRPARGRSPGRSLGTAVVCLRAQPALWELQHRCHSCHVSVLFSLTTQRSRAALDPVPIRIGPRCRRRDGGCVATSATSTSLPRTIPTRRIPRRVLSQQHRPKEMSRQPPLRSIAYPQSRFLCVHLLRLSP